MQNLLISNFENVLIHTSMYLCVYVCVCISMFLKAMDIVEQFY